MAGDRERDSVGPGLERNVIGVRDALVQEVLQRHEQTVIQCRRICSLL
jgi:hypothetical protein